METTLDRVWTWREDAATYRGPDRRRAATARVSAGRRRLLGVHLLTGQLLIGATFLLGSWHGSADATEADWLTASVAVVSALAAVLFAVWWRLVGDAAALWVSSALSVYAAVNIAFPDLLRPLADTDAEVTSLAVLRPASVIVVMGLLAIGAATPRVDASLSARRARWCALGLGTVGALAAWGSIDVRLIFGPAIDEAPSEVMTAFGQIGIGAMWLALAVVFFLRARRDWETMDAWVGLMLIGFAEARLTLAMSVQDPAWLLASQVGRLLGVTAALLGILNELQRSFVLQRGRLLSTDAELIVERSRFAAERAHAEERAHDVRSALAGIGSAAVTLERYHDELSAAERDTLSRSVAAEIARLQQIVAAAPNERSSFELAPVLEPIISCARSQGMHVQTRIGPDLVVWASADEVVEVVQNLLDNARRHAPNAAVEIGADRVGDRVEVTVEDDGPGIDAALRDRIFERGFHGGAPGSSGLGLYVAARLVRANGGDLSVAAREPSGTCFTISLPGRTTEVS